MLVEFEGVDFERLTQISADMGRRRYCYLVGTHEKNTKENHSS